MSVFYFIVTGSTCSFPLGKIENAIIGHSPWLRRRSGGTSCCYFVTTESRTACTYTAAMFYNCNMRHSEF